LLGCVLVCRRRGRLSGDGAAGRLVAGRIVETEAYVGEDDRACHAHSGKTARNAVMYGPPGHAYVYFVYGMHDMMNVVCQPANVPEAVLVRALEPIVGLDVMRRRRPAVRRALDLASGPGKLCRALGITRQLNGTHLGGDRLWIAAGSLRPDERIARSARIGVDYAGDDALRPLRFYLVGNPHVSRRSGAHSGGGLASRDRRGAAPAARDGLSATPSSRSRRRA
jgi:DNA-3-methyladenine glycosylase